MHVQNNVAVVHSMQAMVHPILNQPPNHIDLVPPIPFNQPPRVPGHLPPNLQGPGIGQGHLLLNLIQQQPINIVPPLTFTPSWCPSPVAAVFFH